MNVKTNTIYGSLLTIVLAALLLQSCTIHTFDKPVPSEISPLKKFPKQLRGNWTASSFSYEFPLTHIDVTKDSLFLQFASSGNPSSLGIKNDSLRLTKNRTYYTFNLLSQYGWTVFKIELNGDSLLEISGIDKRSTQIVTNYKVYELPNKLTVISYKPLDEDWDQIMKYGLTTVAQFRKSK